MTTSAPTHSDKVTFATSAGGIGGLVFVGALLMQNVLRATAPGFDATPAEVVPYFSRAGAAAVVPLVFFPFEMPAVFLFVASIWTHAHSLPTRWWASVGVLGATSIAALFGIVNIMEIVLVWNADRFATDSAVVQAVWSLRTAAFCLDLAAIAVALIGLSRAAAPMGLIHRWTAAACLPGATCLLIASALSIALQSNPIWLGIGLIGFVVWLVFVANASVSLMRGRQI
ncbi:MAG: hypothetical protein JOZ65_04375 [Chloroflexi bacterium]|nr:hypothetical protein [Chloroflexota bacterium]